MKLKYRVKFKVTNLEKDELRDFNLNLLESKNIMEFDCDQVPELPSSSEVIKIANRNFKISSYNIEYIIEENEVIQIYNVSIFDVDKKEKNKKEIENLTNEMIQQLINSWKK